MHPRAPPVLGCGGASPPSSGQAAPLPSRPGAWMKRAAIWEELRAASGQDPGRNRGHSPTPLGQGILPTAACEQLEHRKPKLPTESQSLCWQSWSPEAPCLRGFLSPQNLSWAWRFQSGPARDPGPGTNRRRHAPDSAGRVSRLRSAEGLHPLAVRDQQDHLRPGASHSPSLGPQEGLWQARSRCSGATVLTVGV